MAVKLSSKSIGNTFEEILDFSCDYYRKKGIACIQKTPEPFKAIKVLEGGRVMGFYTKKAQPDYKGVLKNGQCIIFEAKATMKDCIKQQAVSDVQTKVLDEYEAMGAQCFIMACFSGKDFYRIPWRTWKIMKEMFGRKYARKDELKKYQLPEKNGILLILQGIELPGIVERKKV